MENTTKLTIHFAADPSVGIFPYSYSMEIPSHCIEDGERENVFKMITDLYAELDGDFFPVIYVEGENQD
jgi:hypothetical protein